MTAAMTPGDLALLRTLDATFDRLGEALRTVEDRLRFGCSLTSLPGRFKSLRHEARALAAELEAIVSAPLASFREVGSDVGRPRNVDDDRPTRADGFEVTAGRSDGDDLLAANLARARESIRSIEETLRTLPAAHSLIDRAERLRYTIYQAESVAIGSSRRRPRLADVRLYALVTTSLANGDPRTVTRAAVAGGVQLVQLREKNLESAAFLQLARDLREITTEGGALFVINDDVAIAALSQADGVHQGQSDLPPGEVRKILGPDAIVGVSTHAPEQAAQAEADGADYIGVGPIFPTQTKEHRSAVGLEYIAAAHAATDLPAFAIGSVNRDSLDAVIAGGARRVAVCTGIIAADDVEATARWFRERLDAAWESTHEQAPR